MVATAVEGGQVVFRLADPERRLAAVRARLRGIPVADVELGRVDGGWEARVPCPPVRRLEYRFELVDAAGNTVTRTDPGNPVVAGGPFGETSWIPLPDYAAPVWLDAEPVPSSLTPLAVETPLGQFDVQVWAPADAEPAEALPLLVAHDGPEFAMYAGLTQYAGGSIARGDLPRFRLALAGPGARNDWYSANPAYASVLAEQVLPAVRELVACGPAPVLTGASLGGLAALHVEWTHPGTFAGVFCQSGSFFTPVTDPQERDFGPFDRITGFVAEVLAATTPPGRPCVGIACGTAEENLENNRVIAAKLTNLGLETSYDEIGDAHNFTAWRDMLDPYLTRVLRRVWG